MPLKLSATSKNNICLFGLLYLFLYLKLNERQNYSITGSKLIQAGMQGVTIFIILLFYFCFMLTYYPILFYLLMPVDKV